MQTEKEVLSSNNGIVNTDNSLQHECDNSFSYIDGGSLQREIDAENMSTVVHRNGFFFEIYHRQRGENYGLDYKLPDKIKLMGYNQHHVILAFLLLCFSWSRKTLSRKCQRFLGYSKDTEVGDDGFFYNTFVIVKKNRRGDLIPASLAVWGRISRTKITDRLKTNAQLVWSTYMEKKQ